MQGLLEGTLALQKQVDTNWEELALSAYRKHIPVYHTEHVYTLLLDPKNKNTCEASLVRFNTPRAYFLSPGINPNWLSMCDRYGVPSLLNAWYKLPLSSVVSIEKIVDNPVNPTVELFPGKDFDILWDSVQFYSDPCMDGKSKEFFLINVKQDFKWIYRHFGYLLDLESKSCPLYRQVVDDIFNAYIDGSAAVDIFAILAAVTGNIVSKESETVTEVTETQITTDKNSYELLPGRTASVSVGDPISIGDSLTQDFTPIYLNQLAMPERLPAVLLPKRYLGPDYFFGIVFVNQDMPVFTMDGQSRFYIGGNSNDVELFWSDFEKHCESHGTTVNEVISLCISQYTNLINPYKFFAEHIGRYHYTLLSIDYRGYPSDLTLDSIPLRRLMPPWSTLLIQQRLEIETSVVVGGRGRSFGPISAGVEIGGEYRVPENGNIYAGRL